MAASLGVEWIDLKNPDAGSLGAADADVARQVAASLSSSSYSGVRLTSAAAGELRDDPQSSALMLAQYFPLVKVGLAGLGGSGQWQAQFQELALQLHQAGAQLVPVIYADYGQCNAPAPQTILDCVAALEARKIDETGSRYLLVDTFTKRGERLLDWLDETELTTLMQRASQIGRQTVLAGSLALSDLPKLLKLPMSAIAVRGAVCSGDRRSGLCEQKVQQWLQLVQNQ